VWWKMGATAVLYCNNGHWEGLQYLFQCRCSPVLVAQETTVTCNILKFIAIITWPSNKYKHILVKYCLMFIASIAIIAIRVVTV